MLSHNENFVEVCELVKMTVLVLVMLDNVIHINIFRLRGKHTWNVTLLRISTSTMKLQNARHKGVPIHHHLFQCYTNTIVADSTLIQ